LPGADVFLFATTEPQLVGADRRVVEIPAVVAVLAPLAYLQVGLGRIVALYYRSSTSHQIC
jgi:hypothetical protein